MSNDTKSTPLARCLRVRAEMTDEIGRTPTLAAIAERVGLSNQRVHQLFASAGISTVEGRDLAREAARAARVARKESRRVAAEKRNAGIRKSRARIIELHQQGLTQVQIAAEVGTCQSEISRVIRMVGLRAHRASYHWPSATLERVAQQRADKVPWADIAAQLGVEPRSLRAAFARWLSRTAIEEAHRELACREGQRLAANGEVSETECAGESQRG